MAATNQNISNTFILSLLIFQLALECQVGCHGAKILFYNVIVGKSHLMLIHPLAIKLVENGHNVTILSSLPLTSEEHPKIKYFYPKKVVEYWYPIVHGLGTIETRINEKDSVYVAILPICTETCKILLESQDFKEWNKNASFDLLIIDASLNECALGLGYKFKAPHIIFQTAPFAPWFLDPMGMTFESSWLPDMRLRTVPSIRENANGSGQGRLGFFQRVYNTIYILMKYLIDFRYFYFPEIEKVLKEGLGLKDMPRIEEMAAKDSRMIFVNSYFAGEYGRAFPNPFVVPVGGIHCDLNNRNESLPEKISSFISKFPGGFVFVSFGTIVELPMKMKIEAFKMFQEKFPNFGFIVKLNGELPDHIPPNVLSISWAPQQILLAHPKIRAFHSHCGMLSTQEAFFYGVPVLASPFFCDQDYNAQCMVRKGVAILIDLVDQIIDLHQWEDALQSILYDKRYQERMDKISEVYRDRPLSPLDTSVWWVDYVLRHEVKGHDLSNMKPLGIEQNWFERRLLDVWGFIFSLIILTIILGVKLFLFLIKLLWSPNANGSTSFQYESSSTLNGISNEFGNGKKKN